MIPIGIVGFMLKDQIDEVLASNYIMVVVGAMLLVTATLLAFAYYAKPRQKETISYRDALIIGVAQAVAASPGLSRSGSTIATGLLLGNRKDVVATFSFLMVLAPIMGETLLHILDGGFAVAGISTWALIAGFVTAFDFLSFGHENSSSFLADLVRLNVSSEIVAQTMNTRIPTAAARL